MTNIFIKCIPTCAANETRLIIYIYFIYYDIKILNKILHHRGRGLHAAHGRARRMVALPPPRCMTEFRAYIAALQTYAVPGSEQRAASTRAFI
jgi:hypothetical protein